MRREKMMVSVTGEVLTVMLSDSNLPEKTCEKVVRTFAQELHVRATGRELSNDEIEVFPAAILMQRVCEQCSERIVGPAYSCPVCHRCFCYRHRVPEKHGCRRDMTDRSKILEANPSKRISSSRSRRRPAAIISKVPCG